MKAGVVTFVTFATLGPCRIGRKRCSEGSNGDTRDGDSNDAPDRSSIFKLRKNRPAGRRISQGWHDLHPVGQQNLRRALMTAFDPLRSLRLGKIVARMTDEMPNPYADRGNSLRTMKPQLFADVRLYATEDGGKAYPAYPGWGCPCMVSQEQPLSGYDGWPILDDPIEPGEERKGVGFVFLSPEGAEVMRRAGRFYLWEGKFIGEASVVG